MCTQELRRKTARLAATAEHLKTVVSVALVSLGLTTGSVRAAHVVPVQPYSGHSYTFEGLTGGCYLEDDPGNSQWPWGLMAAELLEGHIARASVWANPDGTLADPGRQGVARVEMAMLFQWDLGGQDWEDVKGCPIRITVNGSYNVSVHYECDTGSAEAAIYGPTFRHEIGYAVGTPPGITQHLGTLGGSYDATLDSLGDASCFTFGFGVYCQAHCVLEDQVPFGGNGSDAYLSIDRVTLQFPHEPWIPGDTDDDGDVDADDAATLAGNWGADVATGGSASGDFNGDTWVDAADASILAANWTGSLDGPDEASSVPEPSPLVLLGIGAIAWCASRRRPCGVVPESRLRRADIGESKPGKKGLRNEWHVNFSDYFAHRGLCKGVDVFAGGCGVGGGA